MISSQEPSRPAADPDVATRRLRRKHLVVLVLLAAMMALLFALTLVRKGAWSGRA